MTRTVAALAVLALAGVLAPPISTALGDEEGDAILAILAKTGPSVLAVSFEQKSTSPYMSGGIAQVTTGLAVGPRTVIVSTGAIEPMKDMPDLGKILGGGGGGFGGAPKAPTEFKVTLGEEQVVKAKLTGRADELGLAFLTVEGEQDLAPMAFDEDVELAMAQELVFVAPSQKRYLHRKRFLLTRVNELLDGRLYGVAADAQAYVGGVAATLDGRVVGLVAPDPEDLPKPSGAGAAGGGNPLTSLAQGLLSSGQIRPSPRVILYQVFKELAAKPPENVKPEEASPAGGKSGGDDDWDDDEF
ncbi:MAG: hypothetical protein HY722_16405 [Planctomycetes bacterium]|nr:hypothetical protein [Planctomycetota bacterium]